MRPVMGHSRPSSSSSHPQVVASNRLGGGGAGERAGAEEGVVFPLPRRGPKGQLGLWNAVRRE